MRPSTLSRFTRRLSTAFVLALLVTGTAGSAGASAHLAGDDTAAIDTCVAIGSTASDIGRLLASIENGIVIDVQFLDASENAQLASDPRIVTAAAPASFATDAEQDPTVAPVGAPPANDEAILTSPAPASFATDADQDPG